MQWFLILYSDPGSGSGARERSCVVWFPSYTCSLQCPCPLLLKQHKELSALSLQQQRAVLLVTSCRGQTGYSFPILFTRSSGGSNAADPGPCRGPAKLLISLCTYVGASEHPRVWSRNILTASQIYSLANAERKQPNHTRY